MAETPTPYNKEAFNAFVKQYNLDPLNKDAINNCLFDLYSTNIEIIERQNNIDARLKNNFAI